MTKTEYVLVPRIEDDAMCEAGLEALQENLGHTAVIMRDAAACYRAMIATAPEPQPEVTLYAVTQAVINGANQNGITDLNYGEVDAIARSVFAAIRAHPPSVVEEAVKAEREACALVCVNYQYEHRIVGERYACLIRARSATP